MKIAFEIPLVAKPKAEKDQRFVPHKGGGGHIQKYNDKDTRAAMGNVVALCAPHAPAIPLFGALALHIVCFRPMPMGWIDTWRQEPAERGLIRPATRPDWDNYAKLIGDALKNSGAWFRDDGQVVDGRVEKYFSIRPRIGIAIEEVAEISSAVEWRAYLAAHGSGATKELFAQGTH